jgi:hypothetical protein
MGRFISGQTVILRPLGKLDVEIGPFRAANLADPCAGQQRKPEPIGNVLKRICPAIAPLMI